LRCSDVPYIRHNLYHLPPLAYFRFALHHLRALQPPVRRATIFFNAALTHHSFLRNRVVGAIGTGGAGAAAARRAGYSQEGLDACRALATSLRTFVAQVPGLHVSLDNTSAAPDVLAAFLASRAVISAVPSSFSFIAGVTKERARGELFVTPLYDTEAASDPGLSKLVHWTMFDVPNIKHSHVLAAANTSGQTRRYTAFVEDYAAQLAGLALEPECATCANDQQAARHHASRRSSSASGSEHRHHLRHARSVTSHVEFATPRS